MINPPNRREKISMKKPSDIYSIIKAIQPKVDLRKPVRALDLPVSSDHPGYQDLKGPLPDFSVFPDLERLKITIADEKAIL